MRFGTVKVAESRQINTMGLFLWTEQGLHLHVRSDNSEVPYRRP
jgi:hypothetical protein